MLIIIEGVDKSGKTTLARTIEKELGFKYAHFGAPGPNPASEYIDFLLNLKEPTVCDRFYLGEQVYGPLLRKKSSVSSLQKTTIERLCRSKGVILIRSTAPLEVCQKRLIEMGDTDITPAQNEMAYKMFLDVFDRTNIMHSFFYDSSKKDCLGIVEGMRPIIELNRRHQDIAAKYCTGIGTISGAKLVIVGESVNVNTTWRGLPFDQGSSAEFLLSCLKEAGVPEHMVYICNADGLTHSERVFLTYNSGKMPALALGSKAQEKLVQLQWNSYRIDHPAYIKRFKLSQRSAYIEYIKHWVATCKEML